MTIYTHMPPELAWQANFQQAQAWASDDGHGRYLVRRWYLYPLVNVNKKLWKSSCLMGKSTISMAIFNNYVCLPEGMCLCMICYVSNRGFFYNQNHVPSGKQLFSQTY